MKIIFSPSKTQATSVIPETKTKSQIPFFQESTEYLLQKLKSLSEEELKKIFKTSDKITQEVFSLYQNIGEEIQGQVLASFTGTAFGELDLDSYTQEDWKFAQEHVRILSGFYGVLRPLDQIHKYRLDMNDKIFAKGGDYKNLYDFWRGKVAEYFKNEEVILNLASGEYSKMLSVQQRDQMVTVDFLIQKNGDLKSVSVYAKQQRGKMLNWIIKKKIKNPADLDLYESDGFYFDRDLSSEKKRVFVKSLHSTR